MPNKLSQFWQELKRRNVVRVITVYAGAAFVIIELINNITEPLRLPEWTPTLIIVLLVIGFPIVIIFSWIYDVHPDDGIVKTEPADKGNAEGVPKSYKGWKVASYISFVVIVGLIALNVLSGNRITKARNDLPLSIAILPFTDESPEGDNQYIVNNLMTSILESLSSIEGLTVKGRSSTEKYRDKAVSPQEIGEELGVSYLIEGWGTLLEDEFTVDLNLIVAHSGDVLWSETFPRKYTVRDLSSLKSDIAFRVLDGVQATISEEEAERIKKSPDIDMKDYDLYMQAEEYLWEYQVGKKDTSLLSEAENLYRRTAEQEPSFARAYLGLAKVYWEKNYWNEYLNPNFMETFNNYIETAFLLDDKLDEIYLLKGRYFARLNDITASASQYNWAIQLNPNSFEAYANLGIIYINFDQIKSLENLFKATEIYNGPELDSLNRAISTSYAMAGFYDQSERYAQKALVLNQDSVAYLTRLAINENWKGNFGQSIDLCLDVLKLDPMYEDAIDRLAYNYMLTGEYEEAYHYYKMIEPQAWLHRRDKHRLAFIYDQHGNAEEADSLFAREKNRLLSLIELGRSNIFVYYDLAGINAFTGNKDEALKLLSQVSHYSTPNDWFVTLIKHDPLFDSIRDEPIFQQVVQDLEIKSKTEYERVRQWLEENDML